MDERCNYYKEEQEPTEDIFHTSLALKDSKSPLGP